MNMNINEHKKLLREYEKLMQQIELLKRVVPGSEWGLTPEVGGPWIPVPEAAALLMSGQRIASLQSSADAIAEKLGIQTDPNA
jgi:hypothetical protein